MPKTDIAASAESRVKALYPEGGPGRHLKARLKAGEVLVGATLAEYTRPSLIKLYQQAGFDFVYVEYEHIFFGLPDLADTVLSARDNGLPVIAKTPQLERQEVRSCSSAASSGYSSRARRRGRRSRRFAAT